MAEIAGKRIGLFNPELYFRTLLNQVTQTIASMEKRQITSEGYFRVLLILYAGMLMSQVTMAGTMIYLNLSSGLPPTNPEMETTFLYVLVAAGTTGLGASFLLVNSLIARAADKPTLAEKLRGFQTATIIRYALLEAPSILGAVGFYLTGQYLFFIATGLAIVVFLLFMPTRPKVAEALRLSGDELRILEDPTAVVMEQDISTSD